MTQVLLIIFLNDIRNHNYEIIWMLQVHYTILLPKFIEKIIRILFFLKSLENSGILKNIKLPFPNFVLASHVLDSSPWHFPVGTLFMWWQHVLLHGI